MNWPFDLEGREREDALPQFLVRHAKAQAARLDLHRFVVEQLLQDALADAELLQHLLVELLPVPRPRSATGLLLYTRW